MIKEMLTGLYAGLREFAGTGAVIAFFAVSVLVLILTANGKVKERALLALSFVPACGFAVSEFLSAAVRSQKKTAHKLAIALTAVAISLLAVFSSGKSVISPEFTERAENPVHVPDDIYSAMQFILQDGGNCSVLVDPEWSAYFESFSSSFTVTGHKKAAGFSDDEGVLNFEMSKTTPDMRKIASIARRNGCTYVVLPDDIWPEVPITKFGYETAGEFGSCIVYKEVTSP
ncbi:MAG: hypothetical protein K6F73_10100 [Lachnospiraceae bacterium]|nr:hypothetical protein [Lachnospiraceae bacterium]